MAWTDIPDTDIDADSPITETLMTQIRDNIENVRQVTQQIFTTSGTYTKPTGLAYALVQVVGGGGGGGGADSTAITLETAASGGDGGGMSVELISAASIGATETVTVGSGGTAGAAAGGGDGGAGGSSSFGSHCSATGGAGGKGHQSTTQNMMRQGSKSPGLGSGGDYNLRGGYGQDGYISALQATGSGLYFTSANANIYCRGGDGGFSPLGTEGGKGGDVTTDPGKTAGTDATYRGAGGGGAAGKNTTNGEAGGAGGGGIVIVTEYY